MHGSIFVLFKRFVENTYDFETWNVLVKKAKITHGGFEMHGVYPDAEIVSLISAASEITKLSRWELQEKFGEALVPDLLLVYHSYIRPEWRTLDLIEHTEKIFHKAAREKEAGIDPPALNVMRTDKNKLIIDYFSKRRMGSLAIGIIRGLAKYYKEEKQIRIESTTDPDAERVQIKVEFTKINPGDIMY